MSETEPTNVFDNYYEAIGFFQRYPDQWEAFMQGILAKRNALIAESDAKLNNYAAVERGTYAIGMIAKMGAIDSILREIAVDYTDYNDPQENNETDG